MTDEELQLTRDFILRAAARFPNTGATRTILKISLESIGMDHLSEKGPDSLDAQIEYLISAEFLVRREKAHTASYEFFKITPKGDDYLRKSKLL